MVKRLAALAFALLCPVFGWAQYNSYIAFAAGTAPSYEDLWWNPAASGWGVSIAQQGDAVFATYYTYDASGKGEWYLMSNSLRVGASYFGPLLRARGPSFDSAWDASKVSLSQVGTATFTF